MSPCNIRRDAIVVKPNTVTPALKLLLDVTRKLLSKLGRVLEPLIHTSNHLQFFGHRNASPHLHSLWLVMEEYFRSLWFLREDNKKPMEFNSLTLRTVRVDLNPLIFVSLYLLDSFYLSEADDIQCRSICSRDSYVLNITPELKPITTSERLKSFLRHEFVPM